MRKKERGEEEWESEENKRCRVEERIRVFVNEERGRRSATHNEEEWIKENFYRRPGNTAISHRTQILSCQNTTPDIHSNSHIRLRTGPIHTYCRGLYDVRKLFSMYHTYTKHTHLPTNTPLTHTA